MRALRTPDERFEDLDGFPHQPNYLEVDDGDGGRLRMHYVDEGPPDGEVVLLLHGQPVWSYSFRKMIPPLTAAGYRVIAPDIVGFGRSDKPSRRSDYTFARHVHWMHGFVRGLSLTDVTLLGQDWGGPIGLRVVTADPDRFARVVATNTGLADARDIPDEMAPKLRQLLAETAVLLPKELDRVMRARVLESERPSGFQDQTRDAVEGFDARTPRPFPPRSTSRARGSSRASSRCSRMTPRSRTIARRGRFSGSSRSPSLPRSATPTPAPPRSSSSRKCPARKARTTRSSPTPCTIPRTTRAKRSPRWSSTS